MNDSNKKIFLTAVEYTHWLKLKSQNIEVPLLQGAFYVNHTIEIIIFIFEILIQQDSLW